MTGGKLPALKERFLEWRKEDKRGIAITFTGSGLCPTQSHLERSMHCASVNKVLENVLA
jgi:hypothetical protein